MVKSFLQSLKQFRKCLSISLILLFISCFLIIAKANFAFAEDKLVTDEINAFLTIQDDAHIAISSGIVSLERSCFSDLPEAMLGESLTILKQNIDTDRKENLDELSLLQNSIMRIDVNSRALVSENCSLFDLLLDNSPKASTCRKSQSLKKTSETVLSQILMQKQISEKMYEAFDRLLQLEVKECATTGFTFNIFSSYLELIRNSVGITKIFYETKLLHLKTQVQEMQKND